MALVDICTVEMPNEPKRTFATESDREHRIRKIRETCNLPKLPDCPICKAEPSPRRRHRMTSTNIFNALFLVWAAMCLGGALVAWIRGDYPQMLNCSLSGSILAYMWRGNGQAV